MSNANISELTYHINSYSKGINYTHKGLGLVLKYFLKIGACAWVVINMIVKSLCLYLNTFIEGLTQPCIIRMLIVFFSRFLSFDHVCM